MSKTPRTDNFFAQTITMNETDSLSGWLSLSTDLETKLTEAWAEIEQLKKGAESDTGTILRQANSIRVMSEELAEARAETISLAVEVGQALMLRSISFAAGENIRPRDHAIWRAMRKTIGERDEARAEADHWKSECNALQRMVHEARAEIERLKSELDTAWAKVEEINKEYAAFSAKSEVVCIDYANKIAAKDKLIEQMREALKAMLRYPMLPIELDEIAEAALAAERGE